MLQANDVLVVVPAFNEVASIGQVLVGIQSHGFRVLVIDDGSTDETSVVAHQKNAIVLSLPLNIGVGGALRCGFFGSKSTANNHVGISAICGFY